MTDFYQGNEMRLSGSFTDLTQALVDPTTVTIRIRLPNGNVEVHTPTRQSLGVWSYDFITTLSGTHYYRFEGTGAVIAADEQYFVVAPSKLI